MMNRLVMAVTFTGLASACVPHTYTQTEKLNAQVPTRFSNLNTQNSGTEVRNSLSVQSDQQWWKEFEDRKLEVLITEALQSNLDIEMSRARLDQALALAKKSGAAYWPQLEVNLGGVRAQSVNALSGQTSINNRFDVSAAARYEIDLWGKYRNQRAGAIQNAEASNNDVKTILMTIAAQVSETWYLLAEQRSQQQLLEQQTKINETMYELVKARFEQGLASALDVYQQKQQLIRTRRRLQPTIAQVNVVENQLAVLLGTNSKAQIPSGKISLPQIHRLPSVGVPAQLIVRRPDVLAALARVKAADHQIAAAIADRFPAVRLSASTGFQALKLEDLLDNFIWSLVGGLVAPIFEGGRRSAEVDQKEAGLRLAIAQYKKVIITAIREVEDALIRLEKKSAELKELELEVRVSQSTFNEAQNRYLQGLGNYLPVLTALGALQESQRTQLNAKRQLISFRIQLYRALGGDLSLTPQKEQKQ